MQCDDMVAWKRTQVGSKAVLGATCFFSVIDINDFEMTEKN